MAYDALREKTRTGLPPTANPYETLLSATPPQTAQYSGIPATAQRPPGDEGPSASGYVNFDRVYNANSDVAQREAGNRAGANESKAKGVQQGLTGSQNQFTNAMNAGTNHAPDANTVARAGGGGTSFYQPPAESTVPRAQPAAGTSAISNPYSGLTGVATANPVTQDTAENFRADLAAGARRGYTGPGGLSSADSYAKLAQDADAAQDQVNNPLVGLNQTDAALLGAAGRPRFEQDKQRYGHLKSDLDKADAASAQQASDAQKNSEAARLQYEALGNQYDSLTSPTEAKPKGPITINAAPGVGGAPATVGYGADSHDFSRISTDSGSNEGFNADWTAGKYNDVIADMGFKPGENDSIAKFVQSIGGLSSDQWAQLRNMTHEQRMAWLADQKKKHGITHVDPGGSWL